MTTIAASRKTKTMAGDTLVTGAGAPYHTDKIFEIGGSLVGVCGTATATTRFLAWFRKECPPEGDNFGEDDEFYALVLNKKGLFFYGECAEPDELDDDFHAIGSGGKPACMAMFLGKTPAEAVQAVIDSGVDQGNTGGEVRELDLVETSRKARKAKSGAFTLPPDVQAVAFTDKPEAASVADK